MWTNIGLYLIINLNQYSCSSFNPRQLKVCSCLRLSVKVPDAGSQVSSRPAGARLPQPAEVHLPSADRTVRRLHNRRNPETDATETKNTDTRGDPKLYQIHRERKISPVYPSKGRSSVYFTYDLRVKIWWYFIFFFMFRLKPTVNESTNKYCVYQSSEKLLPKVKNELPCAHFMI